MGFASGPSETDLRSLASYYALLRLRDLRCYSVEKSGRTLYAPGFSDSQWLASRVVEVGGSVEHFRDVVAMVVSRDVFMALLGPLGRSRAGYCMGVADDLAKALVAELFGRGGRPLVYERGPDCEGSIAEVTRRLEDLEEERYEELESGYVGVARWILLEPNERLVRSAVRVMRTVHDVPCSWTTRMGSRRVYCHPEEQFRRECEALQDLRDNGLSLGEYGWFIIPAPLLRGALWEVLAELRAGIPVPPRALLRPAGCREIPEGGSPPSREVLRSVVAKVLRGLGYSAEAGIRLPGRGGETEVDVWATKGRFRVYVSCDNWNREVGRSIVEEELGRVLSLRDVPHLKVLVVKSLTSEARRAAETYGFHVVELGLRAEAQSSAEICEALADGLTEMFVSIAPRQLAEAYRRVEELKRVFRTP